jgi:3-methyladenine DNA glycosylase/8-oxoguanine DNA glycosylase
LTWQGEAIGIRYEDAGTLWKPRVRLSLWSRKRLARSFVSGLVEELLYRRNMHLDLSEFYRIARKDKALAGCIDRLPGMRPSNRASLYEYLMVAIVLQNTSVKRSVQMMQRMFETYGETLVFDSRALCAFWRPDRLDEVGEDELRALKVGYRAKSIKRVSEAFARGVVDEACMRQVPLEQVRRAVLDLYGVGPASAGYILFDVFHGLGELDYLPPFELKVLSAVVFGTEPSKPVAPDRLLTFFERFGRFKMLAAHYLWEDVFWRRHEGEAAWLDALIRL